MRHTKFFCAAVGLVAVLATGCAGPEQKLGRGISNVTEFVRLGEIRRSMEQANLYGSADAAYTAGFFKGFNRSLVRTVVGAFEVATFPIPSYEPFLGPDNVYFPGMSVEPVYPEANRPRFISDSSWSPDTYLGFSGGDIAPMIPGSKFRIQDY